MGRDSRREKDPHGARHGERFVWRLRKRLPVGAEGLDGMNETKDGADRDRFRFRLGLVYSIAH